MWWKTVLGLYALCVHLLLLTVLVKSDFIDKVRWQLLQTTPEISKHYQRLTTSHRRMDGSVPQHAVIFIGDSITAGLATSAVSALSVNYGIGSDTTLGVLNRLPYYRSIDTAAAVVLAIGVNDLPRRDNQAILVNYKKILDSLAGRSRLVVSGILPVDERVSGQRWPNSRITQLNAALQQLVLAYPNAGFVDSSRLLQDDSGNLHAEYHTGDGIHLSTAGYQIWIRQLTLALNDGALHTEQ